MDAAELRATLWSGPLPDPATPARDLAARIAAGADYGPVLAMLRQLHTHGLELNPALDVALARWDWSIDLAFLAVEAGIPEATARLATRVTTQNRRHAALARAHWAQGQPAQAVAHLEAVTTKAETWRDDRACLAEFLWHLGQTDRAWVVCDDLAPQLAPGQAARLRLLGAWLSGGANALARASEDTLPDEPAPLALLWQAWLAERDMPRARAVLGRMAALRAPDAPETRLDRARLELDAENPVAARAELALLPELPPAEWSVRRHILHLRCLLVEGDLAADPGPLWAGARAHALAALRLYPLNAALRSVALATRERAEGWEGLSAELAAQIAPPKVPPEHVLSLTRLGLPRPDALIGPASPEVAAERGKLAGDLWLECGDPGTALAATSDADHAPVALARLAETRAEAHLWRRDIPQAMAVLAPALALRPAHMGLWLQMARARFLAGDFTGAEAALARFRTLKTAQTGAPPPEDLRDRITADALASGQSVPLDEPADVSRKRLGPGLAAHPGLAACWLARPGALPPFRPAPASIPRQAVLYWEGPMPDPVARGIARWRDVLTGWQVDVFDATTARDWLARNDPEAARAFARLSAPALRADLFRAARIAHSGGLFVDSDEYPRDGIADWFDGAAAVLVMESGYGTVANNFLAATACLPLIADFRARILARLAGTLTPYPWWDTGPAQLTAALTGALTRRPEGWPGLRLLSQADYCARVTTNLPFPYKRRPGHWRAARTNPAAPLPPAPGHGQMGA